MNTLLTIREKTVKTDRTIHYAMYYCVYELRLFVHSDTSSDKTMVGCSSVVVVVVDELMHYKCVCAVLYVSWCQLNA